MRGGIASALGEAPAVRLLITLGALALVLCLLPAAVVLRARQVRSDRRRLRAAAFVLRATRVQR